MKIRKLLLFLTLAVGLWTLDAFPQIPATLGWYQIPNTKIRPLCPAGIGGVVGCAGVTGAWGSAAFDTLRNRMLIFGGGHSDYQGNEIYSLNMSTLTMTRITNPGTPTASDAQYNGIDQSTGQNNTPTCLVGCTQPNSNHTYDTTNYLANVDKIWFREGSNAIGGNGSSDPWQFNLATNLWEHKSTIIPNSQPGAVASYDSVTGKLFYHGASSSDTLWAYTPSTDTYQTLKSADGGIDYHMTSIIDTVHRKMIIVGGGEAWGIDINTGSAYARLAIAQQTGCTNTSYPGLTYNPVIDRVACWNGGDTVYLYNVATNVWTSQTYTGGPSITGTQGTLKRFAYVPANDVFVVVTTVDTNAYSLRVSAPSSDTTAPTVPSNLSATAVSSSQIDLAWTASSDNVGVTGYKIFRASAQIATSATNSYSDIGLTPLTSYSYTVSAYDAAANNSSQSSSASATTQAASVGSSSSFQITSTLTGTLPFMVGVVFKKGDIPNFPILDIPESQVIVKRRWNDGSVKHAIASGQTSLTANTAKVINITNLGTAPTGTPLTSTNIQSANPSASIQAGSIGTINLSSLLGTPFRTWISGPEMVECHYRSAVGSDTGLNVWFQVRLYKAGRIWVRAIVENGYINKNSNNGSTDGNAAKTYVPTVIIGGVTVFNNGGSSMTHYSYTRWMAEGWIGGNPLVTPKHDGQYLSDSKLAPNYWKRNPSAATLNGLAQVYTPMGHGQLDTDMGAPGFQPGIGLLPKWDSLYVTSTDSRAYNAVLTGSSSMNSYPIVWRDSNTQLPAKPTLWPNYSIDGGTYAKAAGPLIWNMPHEPSEGYLAYLITGDYWHYETMLFHAATNYLARGNSGAGSGINRVLTSETRGNAWICRTNSQATAVCPTGDDVCAEYQTNLLANATWWKNISTTLTPPGIGDVYEYGFYTDVIGGMIAPWQQHFWDQSIGMGSDIEPLTDMTIYNQLREYLYKFCVGILGDQNNFYFTYASSYNIKIVPGTPSSTNPTGFYANWKDVWDSSLSVGLVTANFDNTLKGGSGADPVAAPTGYWGNLLPAIAYAVDHGAPGASAAWTRLTGATNWNTIVNSGFDNEPEWGIVPRAAAPPSVPLPPGNLRPVP